MDNNYVFDVFKQIKLNRIKMVSWVIVFENDKLSIFKGKKYKIMKGF